MRFVSAFILSLMIAVSSAFAIAPDEILDDPVLEARARALSANLRCMVCQNQSIDDSDAQLAKDLRLLVRERLVAGDDDDAVIDYLVGRYGEFVLLKPRLGTHTLLLWGAAPFALLAGVAGIILAIRRRRQMIDDPVAAQPLSETEQARLNALLKDNEA